MQNKTHFSQKRTSESLLKTKKVVAPPRVLVRGDKRQHYPRCIAAPDSDVELYFAGEYRASQGHQQQRPPEPHQTWTIIYFRSGHVECVINDEVYEAYPGVVILTPPGATHNEYAYTDYSNICVTVGAPPTHQWPCVCLDDTDGTLKFLMQFMAREFQHQALFDEEILRASLTQLDLLLQRANQQPAQARSEMERTVLEAEEIMTERFSQSLTIAAIAREVGVSTTSLHTYFRRLREKTPLDFLHRVRLEHALLLIRGSSLPLETIAVKCGYHSASHLGMHIKCATTQTPGSLRNACQ